MLTRPDKETLLEAVARFLETEVKPAVTDPALSFRVLVAASLARMATLEGKSEEARETAELARLREILGTATGIGTATDLRAANRALAEGIRARAFDAPTLTRVRAHLRETLAAELAVTAPRFDTKARPE